MINTASTCQNVGFIDVLFLGVLYALLQLKCSLWALQKSFKCSLRFKVLCFGVTFIFRRTSVAIVNSDNTTPKTVQRTIFQNGVTRPTSDQGPVSQKSRHFSGLFRVPQLPLYLRNAEVLSLQTAQSSLLVFLVLKTCKKISFSKQADCSLTACFSGARSSRDFRETGPKHLEGNESGITRVCDCKTKYT